MFLALYKYIQKANKPNNFQLTATWYLHFADGKCSFTGFADWWREPSAVGDHSADIGQRPVKSHTDEIGRAHV